MLAIVAPMATELAGLRRATGDPSRAGVTLRVIGVGKRRAEAGMAEVAAESPDAIIVIGFCGAADPALRTGDLHVAELFHSSDCAQPIAADARLTNCAKTWADERKTPLVGGPSVTVSAVAGVKTKSILHAATRAKSVNMEDYWIAGIAAENGIPFASVRAVLDTAGDEVPAYLGDTGEGILDVLRGVTTHPGSMLSLVRLAFKARVARDRLADCMSGLLDAPRGPTTGVARLIR